MKKLSDEIKFHKTDHKHKALTLSLAYKKHTICGSVFFAIITLTHLFCFIMEIGPGTYLNWKLTQIQEG